VYVSLKDVTQSGDLLGAVSRVPSGVAAGRLTQDTVRLDLVEGSPDATYLFWLLRTPQYREYCRARAIGTTNLSLSRDDFLAFPVPPLTERRHALVRLLETLEAKIELNHRMNRTLESVARAIFKSWFIDFDPVHRKLERGSPTFMIDAAGLFPSTMAPSALGAIPEGWRVSTVRDAAAELEAGSRPVGGVSEITDGVPSIGAESIVGIGQFDFAKTKRVPPDFWAGMRRGHVQSRDVLVYKDGGRPGMFEPHVTLFGDGFPFDVCCINEHVYRLRVSDDLSQAYIYLSLSSNLAMSEMRERGTGVAIPSLNSTAFGSVPVLVPSRPVVQRFTQIVEPLLGAILGNAKESRTFSLTRDVLLPKLLSGGFAPRSSGELL
jgi:type I restriction enzyme S subunit